MLAEIDPGDHVHFLTDLLSRIDEVKSQEAYVLLLATIARAKLTFGDIDGARTDMDAAWKILDELTSVDSAVNAAYYGMAAEYYKVRRVGGMNTSLTDLRSRPKPNMDSITRIHCCIWLASIWQGTFRTTKNWEEHMI
jgi:26S proteasome regulatory subunit N9